ncbi:hypothetical protein ACX1C1_23890 [Paenibacillus sp. strain BS8-2]
MRFTEEKMITFTDSHIFNLRDHLKHELYWWPDTLLTYHLDFSKNPIVPHALVFMDLTAQRHIPYQLSRSRLDSSGRLLSADFSFIASLQPGEARSFKLERSEAIQQFDSPIRLSKDEGSLWLDNGVFAARIPNSQLYPVQIPGPIMQVHTDGMKYGNSEIKPGKLRILEIVTTCQEFGPLFADYNIVYLFDGGKSYTAQLRIIRGMEFMIFDEQMTNIDEHDEASFTLYWSGLTPTHRHAPNNPAIMIGDYESEYEQFNWDRIDQPYVGNYSHPVGMWSNSAAGEIPFRLSMYEPQSSIVKVNAASFWDDNSGQSIGAFILDESSWDNGRYDMFCSWDGFAVRFFYQHGLLRWEYPLVSGKRTTAVAIYPHEKDKAWFESTRPKQPEEARYLSGATNLPFHGASYSMFLQIRYSLLSLDKIKDYVLEYPEDARRSTIIFDECPYPDYESFEQFLMNYILVSKLPTHGQRANAGFSAVPYRRMESFAKAYNLYHHVMPAPTRQRVEAILLLLTYLAASEEVIPLLNMHGGPPNLHGDVKRALGYMVTQFPAHPETGHWKELFAKFVETSLRLYTRPDLPGLRLTGGRWAENLGTYTWAFLIPALKTATLLERQADMRNLFATPYAAMLGRWLVHALTAPFAGENQTFMQMIGNQGHYWSCFEEDAGPHRVYLPIGAHSARRTTPLSMRDFAQSLERYDPILAENLHYICSDLPDDFESRSFEPYKPIREQDRRHRGTRPDFKTIAFTGFGIMLRSGVYTQDEVSVFVQQIDEGPNYRWGTAGMGGSGNIYYYAQGKAYSHHGKEDAGDRMLNDCEVACNFGVWKNNKYTSIGPSVMTNAYHSLGTFQYTAIESEKDDLSYSYPEYLERNVLLSGTDYISIYDKTGSPSMRNRFTWSVSSFDEMPQIHLLSRCDFRSKLTTGDGANATDCVWYEGSGDSFAIVSHRKDLLVEKRSYGAVVVAPAFKDTLFRSHYPLQGEFDGAVFAGTAGAIREYEDGTVDIALIQGQSILAKGIYLASENGKTGISLSISSSGSLTGKVSSLAEDRIQVTYEGKGNVRIYLNSLLAEPDDEGMFAIASGEYTLEIVDPQSLPMPAVPSVERVLQGDGTCEVRFHEAPGATRYQVQISEDYGETWQTTAVVTETSCRLEGIINGKKYFVRVCGINEHAKLGEYSHEYPLYPSDRMPEPPEGLDIVIQGDELELTWGSVLGAQSYRLYRMDFRGQQELIYAGENTRYSCVRSDCGEIHQYTVSTVNLCGEGVPYPHPVDDNPASLRNFKPLIERQTHRTSLYGHHPFALKNVHRYRDVPATYPESIHRK